MIVFKHRKRFTVVTGPETYNLRDIIKRYGGVWSPARKGWRVPHGQAHALEKILDEKAHTPLDLQVLRCNLCAVTRTP